ncbi:condensation domain-containing protein, partial [Streptomyces sp. NPDC057690]|uniref:condensation domain-containing protein n=1 Tax=Streptomyces sp. NPDC057690 TaxID=3346214 RepID=UPI0036BD8CD9
PALTAQRFLPDPDGPPGSRRYRTGDLATPAPDTTPATTGPATTTATGPAPGPAPGAGAPRELHYLGRTDHQIKLRGFRIEPAEIERVLLTHPTVHAATVILNPHTPHHPQLAAYTVHTTNPNPGHDTETTLTDLRTHLATHLPTHMIPTTITPLPALPTTPNGKLDPTQLPPPTTTPQQPVSVVDLTSLGDSSAERTLRAVWAAVLGVPEHRIGPDDNYFALGGDSITALRLIAEARTAGVPLSVEQLFLHPTIGELASAMGDIEAPEARASEATASEASGSADGVTSASAGVLAALDPALVPEGVEAAYPLADLQLGILYHVELSDDARLYHDLTSVRVTSAWDEAALRRALDVLCERHEILRTSFDLAEFAEPMQLVHRVATVPLEVEEAMGVTDEGDQESRLRAWWDRESATAFDLAAPPLLRAHVLRWSADTFQLSLSVHHVLLDGWSFSRFTTELLVEYDNQLGSADRPLERMPKIRYRDFVAAEQRLRDSREARTFWRDLLTGVEPLSVPEPDRGRGQDDPATLLMLPVELAAGARRVADELGVPVKSVYLAAHLWALGTWRGVTDVVSGLCGNGRPETEGADLLLGLFLNVLPVRIGVGAGTWADLVRAVFDAERRHLPFRAYPLARIQRDFGRPPFAVMFNYTDFHASDVLHGLRHLTVDGWRYEDRTNFPVLVEVNRLQGGEGVELSVRVDPDETSPAGGARVAELFVQALTALTDDVKHPVSGPS